MPTNLPNRKRIRPPVDGRSIALMYALFVAVLLSTMISHPELFDIVSNGLQAEFAIANPLGDDHAIVLAKAPDVGRCYCD